MKRKPQTQAEYAAVIVVALVSFLHVLMHIMGGFEFAFITTSIGLAFLICFFRNLKIYTTLLIIWAILQLVIIRFPLGEYEVQFSQVFDLGLGFQANTKTGHLYLGVGFAGIIYTILAFAVKMDNILGRKIGLKAFKKDSFLSEILPAEFIIEKRIQVDDDKKWFFVRSLQIEPVQYAIIRGKEHSMIYTGEKQIVQYFKVDNPEFVSKAKVVNKKMFPSGSWAVVD